MGSDLIRLTGGGGGASRKSIDGVDLDHVMVSRKSFAGRERSVTIGEVRRKKDALRLSVLNQQLCKMFGDDNGQGSNNNSMSSPKAIGQMLSGVISPSQGGGGGGETSSSAPPTGDGAKPRLSAAPRQQVAANVTLALLDKNRAVNVGLLLTSQFRSYGLSNVAHKKSSRLPPPLFAEFQAERSPGAPKKGKGHILDEAFKVEIITDENSLCRYTVGTAPSSVHVGGKLTATQLQALLEVLPTAREATLLSAFVEKRGGGGGEGVGGCVAKMELPEQFMYSTLGVKRAHAKVSAVIFMREFEEHCQVLKAQVATIKCACSEVMKSARLKRALEMILAIGNALNKTQFKGFSVGSLDKLTHTKSHDHSQSVLDFFVKIMVDHLEGEVLNFKREIPHLLASSKLSPAVCLAQLQYLRRGLTSLVKEVEVCWEDERVFGKMQATRALELRVQLEAAERVAMDGEDRRHGGEYAFPPHLWRSRDLPTSFGVGCIVGLNASTGVLEVNLDWGGVLFTHRDLHKTTISEEVLARRGSYSALMEGYFQPGDSETKKRDDSMGGREEGSKMNRKFLSTLKSSPATPLPPGIGDDKTRKEDDVSHMVVHQPEDDDDDDADADVVDDDVVIVSHSKSKSAQVQRRGSVLELMQFRATEPGERFEYATVDITKHPKYGFGIDMGTDRKSRIYVSAVDMYARDRGDVDVGDLLVEVNGKKCFKAEAAAVRACLDTFRVGDTVQFCFARELPPDNVPPPPSPSSTFLPSLRFSAGFSNEGKKNHAAHVRRSSALPRLATHRSPSKDLPPQPPPGSPAVAPETGLLGDAKRDEFLGELTAKSSKAESRRRTSILGGGAARPQLGSEGNAHDILSHMTHAGRPHNYTEPDFHDLLHHHHSSTPPSSRDSINGTPGRIGRSASGLAASMSHLSHFGGGREEEDPSGGGGAEASLRDRESEEVPQKEEEETDTEDNIAYTPFTHHLQTFADDAQGVLDSIGADLDDMGVISMKCPPPPLP